jgi:flagellar basal-body rod modification protein FlgD
MATVDALSGSAASTVSPTASGLSALTSADFSKIIFTELGKQDPLQPSDTKALLEQISTLRSIQSNMDLTTNLQKLVSQGEFSSAATLIGKTVSGVSTSQARASGTVQAVVRTKDGTFVQLGDGQRIGVSNLDQIVDAASATNTAGTGT